MKDKRGTRLDILIKKEEDYYVAHCLQFDLVVTANTLEGAQEAITASCVAHIQFSHKHNNIEYLFSPAPKEVWAEYYAHTNDENCSSQLKEIEVPLENLCPTLLPAFMIQEILCDVPTTCGT